MVNGPEGTREASPPSGPSAAVRALVLSRDGYSCACCSTPTTGRPHSVVRRSGLGGDSPSNLLTFLGRGEDPLDPDDHRARVESGIDPCDQAKGYEVPSGQDPALVPVLVRTASGPVITVWLTADGQYSFTPPPGPRAVFGPRAVNRKELLNAWQRATSSRAAARRRHAPAGQIARN